MAFALWLTYLQLRSNNHIKIYFKTDADYYANMKLNDRKDWDGYDGLEDIVFDSVTFHHPYNESLDDHYRGVE